MVKASLVLDTGTTVTIDGTADEVSALLNQFSSGAATRAPSRRKPRSRKSSGRRQATQARARRPGPTEYIRELIGEGFFKTKREISNVRDRLEERAHIYQVTALSAPLYRLVKGKELRRVKEGGAWKYVNP